MYVDIIFILYIAAILISLVCLVFIGLIFVRKNDRENKTYIDARRFIIVVLLTDLLYFVFYYREVVQGQYDLALPFRIVDYTLCNSLILCWIVLLGDMINRQRHRWMIRLGVTVTSLRIVSSIIVTTAFMGVYYNIEDPQICIVWTIVESAFVLITAVIIIYSGIWGAIECVIKLRRNYIVICSVLLLVWGIVQGVLDIGLFSGKYGVSAWDAEVLDPTGAIMFLTNLATCIFVFKEDFSPLFLSEETGVDALSDIGEKLDIIASDHRLTVREREVMELLYNGFTNHDIAEALYISVNTVKKHIRNIYEKLDVSNRIELLHLINAWKGKPPDNTDNTK